MKRTLNAVMTLAGVLALAGCGDDSHDHDPNDHEAEEDPGEHACEAFEDGRAETLSGAAERNIDTPLLEQGEDAYDVSLDESAPRYVRLDGATEGLLFAGVENIVSALYYEDESDDLLPDSAPNEFCSNDIPEHFDLDLDDGDYFLELSPSAVSEVWLIFTTAEGHAHEE